MKRALRLLGVLTALTALALAAPPPSTPAPK